jgi:hypothetical protein
VIDLRKRKTEVVGDKGQVLSTWESDGKLVTSIYPADQVNNEYIWLTGRGDHPTNGRGEGTRIRVYYSPSDTGDKSVEVQFNEQVQLHDGRMFVPDKDKWTDMDEWSYSIIMPATSVSAASPPNTGNCNLVPQTGYNVIVPAAGDGTHDIDDMDAAAPVGAGGAGYWDYDMFTDVLAASATPGSAGWHLLDVDVEAFFMKRLPVPIHAMAVFDMQPYKSERISPRWKLRLTVHRDSTGEATILGWIQVFRQFNTTL